MLRLPSAAAGTGGRRRLDALVAAGGWLVGSFGGAAGSTGRNPTWRWRRALCSLPRPPWRAGQQQQLQGGQQGAHAKKVGACKASAEGAREASGAVLRPVSALTSGETARARWEPARAGGQMAGAGKLLICLPAACLSTNRLDPSGFGPDFKPSHFRWSVLALEHPGSSHDRWLAAPARRPPAPPPALRQVGVGAGGRGEACRGPQSVFEFCMYRRALVLSTGGRPTGCFRAVLSRLLQAH